MEVLLCLCQILSFIAGAIVSGGFRLDFDKEKRVYKEEDASFGDDFSALMNYFPNMDMNEVGESQDE